MCACRLLPRLLISVGVFSLFTYLYEMISIQYFGSQGKNIHHLRSGHMACYLVYNSEVPEVCENLLSSVEFPLTGFLAEGGGGWEGGEGIKNPFLCCACSLVFTAFGGGGGGGEGVDGHSNRETLIGNRVTWNRSRVTWRPWSMTVSVKCRSWRRRIYLTVKAATVRCTPVPLSTSRACLRLSRTGSKS